MLQRTAEKLLISNTEQIQKNSNMITVVLYACVSYCYGLILIWGWDHNWDFQLLLYFLSSCQNIFCLLMAISLPFCRFYSATEALHCSWYMWETANASWTKIIQNIRVNHHLWSALISLIQASKVLEWHSLESLPPSCKAHSAIHSLEWPSALEFEWITSPSATLQQVSGPTGWPSHWRRNWAKSRTFFWEGQHSYRNL